MVSFYATVLAITMAMTASAAPAAEARSALTTGSITYYNSGLGACGFVNNDSQNVAAISAAIYTPDKCGKTIRITSGGRSVDVTVVDKCPGCGPNDLDLTPTAFQQVIGPLSIGRQNADWTWV